MNYDFDKIIDRKNTNCVKWDAEPPVKAGNDVIPLWVADMDFPAAPFIQEALKKRVEHGVFGYTIVPKEYYETVIDWFSRRYAWKIKSSWIIYTTGVVPAISAAIKALTEPGDRVIIQTPVYNCFFSSIKNNGCEISESPLIYKAENGKGKYEMDFEDLERKCRDEKAKVLLLCNPHNPAGRIWSNDELFKVGEICRRHNVAVISDEIHCELARPGKKFTPFASVSKENQHCCVTLNSPSKSFNTAGLQIANIISENEVWRKKIDRAVNINEVCDVNPFGVAGLLAAYGKPRPKEEKGKYRTEGELWLDSLNQYIAANYDYLYGMVSQNLPGFYLTDLEGTYLAWLDCRCIKGMTSTEIENSLLQNEKVWVNAGSIYGTDGFIRINLACPRQILEEGLKRLEAGLKRLASQNL